MATLIDAFIAATDAARIHYEGLIKRNFDPATYKQFYIKLERAKRLGRKIDRLHAYGGHREEFEQKYKRMLEMDAAREDLLHVPEPVAREQKVPTTEIKDQRKELFSIKTRHSDSEVLKILRERGYDVRVVRARYWKQQAVPDVHSTIAVSMTDEEAENFYLSQQNFIEEIRSTKSVYPKPKKPEKNN